MNFEVIFRPSAESDLVDIYEYIASDNPLIAIDFIRRLRSFCLTLSEFPERGSPRDDFAKGVRLLVFEKRVTVAYKIRKSEVQIVRLFYAGRNTPSAFRKSGK